jgi:hypothetical protein
MMTFTNDSPILPTSKHTPGKTWSSSKPTSPLVQNLRSRSQAQHQTIEADYVDLNLKRPQPSRPSVKSAASNKPPLSSALQRWETALRNKQEFATAEAQWAKAKQRSTTSKPFTPPTPTLNTLKQLKKQSKIVPRNDQEREQLTRQRATIEAQLAQQRRNLIFPITN